MPSPTQTPKKYAGGWPSIWSSLKFIGKYLGWWRGLGLLLRVNQKKGFDCPGCAWPDPEGHRSPTEFCENGVKAIAEEATSRHLNGKFFAEHSIGQLRTWSEYELSQSGRLTHPLYKSKEKNHYEEIAWEKAYNLVAERLRNLSHSNEAVFYTSGRTSNEAAFLYQLFARRLGTNNLPDCSNMCHESSGVALVESIGAGKGTVTLDDFNAADLILVVGQNPGTNHPRMLTALQKAARQGCKIVSINPLLETGTKAFIHPQEPHKFLSPQKLASHHVPVKVNGDRALFKGLMKFILAECPQYIDREFINHYTHGFEEFKSQIEKTNWQEIVEQSGISREQIESVAKVIGESRAIMACWAMGLTQHLDSVATIQELTNMLLMGGHIGRPGAGLCPVRGHSNVQGDRTMGIWEEPPEEFLKALDNEFGFTSPRDHGFNTVKTIEAMGEGRVKFFMAMGGNFVAATPDTQFVQEAMAKVDFSVQVSTKLNSSHLYTGLEALILPCLGRSELDIQKSGPQFVSVENSMGIVHKSQGNLPPASDCLRSEVDIVCELGARLFKELPWLQWRDDYNLIRQRIENVIPGFENFNERVVVDFGFYLPNPPRDQRVFKTDTGKANFISEELKPLVLKEDEYCLMTLRSHDQYNTTIYGLNDRYRGIYGERKVVFMNMQDMKQAGFKSFDFVNLNSFLNGELRSAGGFKVVPMEIPRRCLAAYFPETNVLIPANRYAHKSQTPTSKSVPVTLTAVKGELH